MPSAYSRDDVQTHPTGYSGPSLPAVNVKVYDSLEDGYAAFQKYEPNPDPRFDVEWIREHVSDETVDARFWFACSDAFELVETDAAEIFGPDARVWQEGRSGGWVVVDGLPDVEDWDAVALAKWRRFEKWTRAQADDVMFRLVDSIYYNDFAAWSKRGRALRRSSMLSAA